MFGIRKLYNWFVGVEPKQTNKEEAHKKWLTKHYISASIFLSKNIKYK